MQARVTHFLPIIIAAIWSIPTGLLSQESPLPNFMTERERGLMPEYLATPRSNTLGPPPYRVRTMAEWEEVQAVVITWTGWPTILTEIVRYAVDECTVIIVTNNPTTVSNQLTAASIPLDNVEFINEDYNSIWIRDYGQWTVYKDDMDSLTLVDWLYNRPRPADDQIPLAVAQHLDLPIYQAVSDPWAWVHTGGNNLRDGMGTNFSSDLVLDENPGLTEAWIDTIAHRFLGVDRYIKFPILPYDGIHHIDMHMRFIDEETVLIGEYPEGVADGPQIEKNIEYLISQVPTAFGNRFNVRRLPMPPDQFGNYPDAGGRYRTFTNSIFINKTILVPIYEEKYDTTALRIYRENLPGYRVIGIDCNAIIPALGALHCITKLVGVANPLWIAHPKLRDTYQTAGTYPVRAIIEHASGIADATLYYRTDTLQPYVALPMSAQNDSLYTAAIPAQPAGSTVYYYIHATAVGGKQQVRPLTAPEGYFYFRVRGESPPKADFFTFLSTACPGEALSLTNLSDGGNLTYAWSFPGGQPVSASEAEPSVTYDSPGTYDIQLIVSNGAGSDTMLMAGAVVVDEGYAPTFEGFTDVLGIEWEIENLGNDGPTWTVINNGGCKGRSLRMDNFNANTNETRDILRTRMDLGGLSNVVLHFDVAYAPYASGNQYFSDALRVKVIDCDGNETIVYQKGNDDLATTSGQSTAFNPSTCEQWRHEQVDLSPWDDQVITLEFINVGGYGNRLYLDNIDIGSPDKANTAPSVSILQPLSDTTFIGSFPSLQLMAEASDMDGVVTDLSLWVNGDSIAGGNTEMLTVDYDFNALGDYEIVARAVDNLGASTTTDVITVSVTQSTGFNPIIVEELQVFPNPSDGVLRITWPTAGKGTWQLQVLSTDGRQVMRSTVSAAGMQANLQLGQLPAGTYFLRLTKAGRIAIARMVLQP